MKDYLEIILGVLALIGIVYRVAKLESEMYEAIDGVGDALTERINLTLNEFRIHVAVYRERKEQVDYLIHGLDEKINHKFDRLYQEIKVLQKSHREDKNG
ncbi:hypothetical protein [Iningainema tapete]|uniref:Uncharacterized protein n=1 Tax=Iningainema tapete BLCC-T55 TaxID=2748662 RepID=A0A8J7BWU4_9CYAN|nr:hypothetical protein [Iningainema tapete]MBD2771603.1 hypothetical protein [Iningainema tapete BLCC-T55]